MTEERIENLAQVFLEQLEKKENKEQKMAFTILIFSALDSDAVEYFKQTLQSWKTK